MNFDLFLTILGWFGFVFFLVRLVVVTYSFYHYECTSIGQLELALKGVRVKSYGFLKSLIGFVVCVALLVSLG